MKYKDAVLVNLTEEKPDNKPDGNQDDTQNAHGSRPENKPVHTPVKTGDTAPIVPLVIISGLALMFVWGQLFKKKNR